MGVLLKRRGGKFGVHMKNAWQSRHFEIKDGIMYYFEDVGKKAKPRGKLNLSGASLVKFTSYEHAPPFSYSFEIVPTGKEEKWRLCANNQTEMDMWCDSLEKYVKDTTDLSSTPTSHTTGSNNEMTGFLLKRRGGKFGSHMKNAWQGRYFEIKLGCISYFEEGAETVKARGKLNLNDAEVSLVKNTTYEQSSPAPSLFTFELVPLPVTGKGGSSVEEKWRLCATSAEEMQEWCLCIQACLGNEGIDARQSRKEEGDDSGSRREDMKQRPVSSSSLGDQDESSHSTRSLEDKDIFESDPVYGGDNVVMSLAWQRRSARTMSGVDRVACEAAARAALEQEREEAGANCSSALEFDDLELDEEQQEQEQVQEKEEGGGGRVVKVNSSGESITIGGDSDCVGVYVHQGQGNASGSGSGGGDEEEDTGYTSHAHSTSKSLGKYVCVWVVFLVACMLRVVVCV